MVKRRAGAVAQVLAQVLGDRHVGQADDAAVGQTEGAHVDGIAFAVLAELGADHAVAAAAFVIIDSSRSRAAAMPSLAARGAASSRSQAANASAISQRNTGAGLTSTRASPASNTALSRTMSPPPQAPGPISRGIGSMTAIARSRCSALGRLRW